MQPRIKLNMEGKTPKELAQLADSIKISELSYSEKKRLLDEIEHRNSKESKILAQIQESSADISDIM